MPRARSIKPGFFSNEDLSELPFPARLLYAGLWTLADRSGRLEDRPKRIKGQIFPYDNVSIDSLLTKLAAANFIIRYEVDGNRFIAIPTFNKHQNPHKNEALSTIPPPEQHSAGTVQAREQYSATRASSLTPDSGLREPDSQTSSEAVVPDQSRAREATPPRSPQKSPKPPAKTTTTLPEAPLGIICDAIREGVGREPDAEQAGILMRAMAHAGHIHPRIAAFWIVDFCQKKRREGDPAQGTKLLVKSWQTDFFDRFWPQRKAGYEFDPIAHVKTQAPCNVCGDSLTQFGDGMVVGCKCVGKKAPGFAKAGELVAGVGL